MSNDCNCLLSEETEVKYEGDPHAELFFVGESPGPEEVRKGRPFIGPSGKMLIRMLMSIGLQKGEVFVANAARCLIDKDRLSNKEIKSILDSCRPQLAEAIHIVKPKLIICLGDIAMVQVLKKKGITKARGTFFWSEEFNAYVLPTYHPGHILRNPSREADLILDFKKIGEFIKNNYKVPYADSLYSWKEVDSIRPLLDGGFHKENGSYVTAIDTETQGVVWYDPDSIIISYSVAASLTEGWQIYLHEEVTEGDYDFTIAGVRNKEPVNIMVKECANFEEKVAELEELCHREDIKKYFMNQKYDMHRIWNLGIENIKNTPMDIAVAAHAIDTQRFTYPSLSKLYEVFTGKLSHKEEITKAEKADMLLTMKNNREKVTKYSAMDAVVTLETALRIIDIIVKDRRTSQYFLNFCMPIETKLLFMLERFGININIMGIDGVQTEIETYMKKQDAIIKKVCSPELFEIHGKGFKLTKRTALADLLFKFSKDGEEHDYGFGLNPIKVSAKTRLPSTDKNTMKAVLDSTAPAAAKKAIRAFTAWSQYNTLLTKYIRQIAELSVLDGKLHPSYTLTATSSGRTGAKNPSIQNFPKRSEASKLIRKLIIAPEGRSLLEVDYSMAELRLIAHVANETTMKEAFRKGEDIHAKTGLALVGKTLEEVTDPKELKTIRQKAKPVNFGLSYKMSANGLKVYAKNDFGVKLTDQEANTWRNTFLHTLYPKILEGKFICRILIRILLWFIMKPSGLRLTCKYRGRVVI
jgi:uracil-DNA glycosylase family 4